MTIEDPNFGNYKVGLSSPIIGSRELDLAASWVHDPTRAIIVVTSSDTNELDIMIMDESIITLTNIPNCSLLPFRCIALPSGTGIEVVYGLD